MHSLVSTAPVLQPEALTSVAVGVVAGVVFALLCAKALQWWNLKGTFALPLVLPGYILAFAFYDLTWGPALILGGSLGAFLRSYWLHEDKKAGGDLARRARNARSVHKLLVNLHDRRKASRPRGLVEGGQYVLGIDDRVAVVRLPLGLEEGSHGLLLGASGAGKTTTMLWIFLRHLEAGFGGVLIDPKGDRELVERCRLEATALGRPFYCFSLDHPAQHWNPLRWGGPSERADKLIAAEEWTEPHYKRLYQRYLLNVMVAFQWRRIVPDLHQVVELLTPERLAIFCRDIENDQIAARLAAFIDELTERDRRDLGGLRNRLALLVESEHGPYLRPSGTSEDVDLLLAVRLGAVVVFSLNSSRYPETAKLLGAALFQDLKDVVGVVEGDASLRRPAIVAVDEFAAFGADHVLGLFQRARSAALSLLLATQELADLRRVDPAFQDQILGVVETTIAHRQNVPDSAELVAELAGTREAWLHTFQTDDRGLTGHTEGRSEIGSKRRGHEFIIPPDAVKQLDTGQAIVIRKKPCAVHKVRVHKRGWPHVRDAAACDPTAEANRRQLAYQRMYAGETEQPAAQPVESQGGGL